MTEYSVNNSPRIGKTVQCVVNLLVSEQSLPFKSRQKMSVRTRQKIVFDSITVDFKFDFLHGGCLLCLMATSFTAMAVKSLTEPQSEDCDSQRAGDAAQSPDGHFSSCLHEQKFVPVSISDKATRQGIPINSLLWYLSPRFSHKEPSSVNIRFTSLNTRESRCTY